MIETIKEKCEKVYQLIIALAVELYLSNRTMRTTEVLEYINSRVKFTHPYVSVRGVFQAAHRRGNDFEKDAVATVFRSKWGAPLC